MGEKSSYFILDDGYLHAIKKDPVYVSKLYAVFVLINSTWKYENLYKINSIPTVRPQRRIEILSSCFIFVFRSIVISFLC